MSRDQECDNSENSIFGIDIHLTVVCLFYMMLSLVSMSFVQ